MEAEAIVGPIEETGTGSSSNEVEILDTNVKENPFVGFTEVNGSKRESRKRKRTETMDLVDKALKIVVSESSESAETMISTLVNFMKATAKELKENRETIQALRADIAVLTQRIIPTPSRLEIEQKEGAATTQIPLNFSPPITSSLTPSVPKHSRGKDAAATHTQAPQVVVQNQGKKSMNEAWITITKKNQSKHLRGNRKDTLLLQKPQETPEEPQTMEISLTEEQEKIKRKLTRDPRPPQTHEIVVLRFSRMAPRTKVPAKEWKALLKERGVQTHTILFPTI